jgi:hypothetical protein
VARDCRISDIDSIGAVDGQSYYYAIYCVIPGYAVAQSGTSCGDGSFNARSHAARGLAVFARGTERPDLNLMFERSGDMVSMVYRRPSITRNAAGTMLYLPIAFDGTGNFNASEYYLRENGRWERIESEAWLRDLTARLPAGLAVWKGVWPDPVTLRARTGLWRTGDGNCCPTGGSARIQLGIRNRQFVLESLEIIPP